MRFLAAAMVGDFRLPLHARKAASREDERNGPAPKMLRSVRLVSHAASIAPVPHFQGARSRLEGWFIIAAQDEQAQLKPATAFDEPLSV